MRSAPSGAGTRAYHASTCARRKLSLPIRSRYGHHGSPAPPYGAVMEQHGVAYAARASGWRESTICESHMGLTHDCGLAGLALS